MYQSLQLTLTVLCSILFLLSFFINKATMYRVTVVDNKAYWMYNNKLYVSRFNNGKIDTLRKKKLDHMNMSEDDIHEVIEKMGSL